MAASGIKMYASFHTCTRENIRLTASGKNEGRKTVCMLDVGSDKHHIELPSK